MDWSKTKDDPHGVQRLLEILRRQQDVSAPVPSTSSHSGALPVPSTSASVYSHNPFSSAAVTPYNAQQASLPTSAEQEAKAALRRRTYNNPSPKYGLPPSQGECVADEPFDPYAFNPFSTANPVLNHPTAVPVTPKSSVRGRDLSSLSFAEALPILATLSKDTNLLRRLRSLRAAQHDLEKRMVKEYRQFTATADKQYPNPKVRAKENANRRKRMLEQWDECVSKQQQELERAGVPAVKKTAKGQRREVEKQKKVLNVLVDMLDDQEDQVKGN